MKRFVSILIALALALCLAGAAVAAETAPDELRADAEALFQDWEMNGYPDDVGGVYCDQDTGGLVILLVNGTDARRQELLALAGNPAAGLAFGESKYSYNQMRAVQDEIAARMGDGDIHSVAVGWTSANGQVTGFGDSGKEFRVVVSVDESAYDQYAAAWQAQYGDMIYVETGEAPVLLDDARGANDWLLPAAVVFLLAAAVAVLVRRNARTAAAQTAGGGTVTAPAPRHVSEKDAVQAVRDSAVSPPDTARAKLMERMK